MGLLHHVVTGQGRPQIMFVHGFGLRARPLTGMRRWAHLSPRHQSVAVDLRGHGASPGEGGGMLDRTLRSRCGGTDAGFGFAESGSGWA